MAHARGLGLRRGKHRKRNRTLRPAIAATGAFAVAATGELVSLAPGANAASADDFYRLRLCESGGNYSTNTGNGYYGAYQFDLGTWRGLGYSGLPSSASPATQDAAARELQAERGWSPWPACSRRLGLYGSPTRASRESYRPATPVAPSRPVVGFHPTTAPAFGDAMFRTSMVGQVRADVRRWQEQMVRRGWQLAVDGRYGPQSAAVCTAFEREKGLHVETPGIVGPQVWRAAFELPTG